MNIKETFINSIVDSLNIKPNPFTISSINKTISFLNENEYSDFLIALHKGRDYKTSLEKIIITADEFKKAIETKLFADTEQKALKLIGKIENVFYMVEYKVKQNENKASGRVSSDMIFEKMPFSKVIDSKTKSPYFVKKEVTAIETIGNIKHWYYLYSNGGLVNASVSLTQAIRQERVNYYFNKQSKTKLIQGVK